MMKQFIISILVIAGLSSCYRDKGNYSYKNINQLEITFDDNESNWKVAVGDTIQITPHFEFEKDSVEEYLTYEWEFQERVLSTERNLFYIAEMLGKGDLILRVTDTRTDVVYIQSTQTEIASEFGVEGWVVLSDNGGAVLSYFRNTTKVVEEIVNGKKEEKRVYDCKDYIGVYQTINHEALGGTPVKLLEHFASYDYVNKFGNFWVIQQGGIGTIDVGVTTFMKETTLAEQFIGSVYPEGFKPVLMAGSLWLTLAVGEDGKTYSRKKADIGLYHSGFFISTPLTFQDKNGKVVELDGRKMVIAPVADLRAIVVCDLTNKCFVAINDSGEKRAGEVGLIRIDEKMYDAYPSFTRLDDLSGYEIVYCGSSVNGGGNGEQQYYTILKDEKTGEYYSHAFWVEYLWDNNLPKVSRIVGQEKLNFSSLNINEKTVFNNSRRTNYLWISQGSELWFYDRVTGRLDKFYTSFAADITAIDSERYNGNYLGIGLANGEFHVLSSSTNDIGDEAYDSRKDKNKLLYSTPKDKNLGRIVDVRYKTMGNNGWAIE